MEQVSNIKSMEPRLRGLPSVARIPTVLAKLPRVARDLRDPESWLKELGVLYRAARRGELLLEEATKLAYVAGNAAKLARELGELRKARELQAERLRLCAQAGLLPVVNGEEREPVPGECVS